MELMNETLVSFATPTAMQQGGSLIDTRSDTRARGNLVTHTTHTDAGTNIGSYAMPPDDMLLLVDFKWLMAGMGWWVDLSRWRRDEPYAQGCLDWALASHQVLLHALAREIGARGLASCEPSSCGLATEVDVPNATLAGDGAAVGAVIPAHGQLPEGPFHLQADVEGGRRQAARTAVPTNPQRTAAPVMEFSFVRTDQA
jgi:hypothetical protein